MLFDLYLKSVGRGAGLDLGLAPDTRGQLHDDDVVTLKTFGDMVKHTFSNNLAKDAQIIPTNMRGKNYNAAKLLDGNKNSYWATTDNAHTASLEIDLKSAKTFDIISLQEYIPLGQRIEEYDIEIFEHNGWKKIYCGISIGAKRLIKLETPVTASKVKLNITKSPVCITLSEFGLYKKAD